MSAPLHISKLSIEGFRGIRERKTFDLDNKSLLLFGNGGTGKTSVLRAIEWCLFDKLPYMKGEEFKREDPIVNDFHPGEKANVEVVLKDKQGRIIQVRREREKKESILGKSSLFIMIDGVEYKKKEAKEKLNQVLGLTLDDFVSRVFLHQEAINDIVTEDPKSRTRAINTILGLYKLSTFINYLPADKKMEKSIEKLSEQITREQSDLSRNERIIEEKETRLQEIKNDLIKKGITKQKLDLTTLSSAFNDCQQSLLKTASTLGLKIKLIHIPLDSISDARNKFQDLISEIEKGDRQREEKFRALMNEISTRKEQSTKLGEISKLKIRDLARLEKEIEEAKEKISNLGSKRSDVRTKRSELIEIQTNVERYLENKASYQKRIRELQGKYGKIEDVKKRIDELKKSIEDLTKKKEKLGALSRSLISTIEYIHLARKDACPTCERPIEYETLRASLEKRIGELEEARSVKLIEDEIKKLRKEEGNYQELYEELERSSKALQEVEQTLEKEKETIERLGLMPKEPLLSFIQEQIRDLVSEDERITREIVEWQTRNERMEKLRGKVEELLKLEGEIQSLLNTKATGESLLPLLDGYTNDLQKRVDVFKDATSKFDDVKNRASTIINMIDFLNEKQELERTKNLLLPPIKRRLKVLEETLQKWREMGAAFHDIREATKQEYESRLRDIQRYLGKDLGNFFTKLLAHPNYTELRLVPEEVKSGEYIHRIKSYTKDYSHETYVQTRFCQSEMNVVALSLFFTMALKAPLGFMILDDPSQSMDSNRLKALTSIIANLIKETQIFLATQDDEFQGYLLEQIPKQKVVVQHL